MERLMAWYEQNKNIPRPLSSMLCSVIQGRNPVPRIYFRGFGRLPLEGVHKIHLVRLWPGFELRSYGVHPSVHARGVLWYGANTSLRGSDVISDDLME